MFKSGHGDEALRRHRTTIPGAIYFTTLCTKNRAHGLTVTSVGQAILDETHLIERDGHWLMRAAVVMPDHFHLLVRLSGSLTISQCVARLKTKTRGALNLANLEWQNNFYEHRLRPDEPIEPVFRYIHLNPYREKLIPVDKEYPWLKLSKENAAWFKPTLNNETTPFPEWLR